MKKKKLTAKKRRELYEGIRSRDGDVCRVCGSTVMLEAHHILFRSQGGPDEPWNLILLCKNCHMRAHNTAKPLLKRDLLHGMIEMGLYGEVTVPTCRTCSHRDPTFFCRLHEEQFVPTYSCESWSEF